MRFGVIFTKDSLLGFVAVQSVYGSEVAQENSISKVQATGLSET
jgi:hypothetical protein